LFIDLLFVTQILIGSGGH